MKVTGSWGILILLTILCCQFFPPAEGSAVVVTHENLNDILSNDLVLLSFYTDWCRFSQLLAPIFEEAAAQVRQKFPGDGRVILGKVDCDRELEVADKFSIVKYPTLKIAKNGLITKEYRGQRSVEAFVQFVEQQLSDPIKEFHNVAELQNAEVGDGLVIGYFTSKDNDEYVNYRKAASTLRDECRFMVGFGEVSRDLHPPGKNLLIFRGDSSTSNHKEYYSEYSGNMSNFQDLVHWIDEKCVPLVREINFENAEELTEEELPFVLIFYNKNDLGPVREFKKVVQSQFADEKRVNFLSADGALFVHPIFHMGKSLADLPLIAIDSFQHMYLFPKFEDIHKPGVLKKFIQDLFSGVLHFRYHLVDYDEEKEEEEAEENASQNTSEVIPLHESKFKDLMPSKHRYTLLNRSRDEL